MSESVQDQFSAVCGLFCPACSLYIGTREDPERLEAIARRFQRPVEDLHCRGCHSGQQSFYCRDCKMKSCSREKGVTFCGECKEYPCPDLTAFQAEMPHRIELWQAQERIRKAGYAKWHAEMTEHYSCAKCGVVNSAYDLRCRNCGEEPSCTYVRLHKNEISEHLAKRK